MRRRVWWAGGILATLVLLPALAAGIAAGIVDPNEFKPQIVAAVRDETGRTLTIDGPLGIAPSLWPTITASGVKLANLPGGTRADMARAERIEAQVALLPLLWRRIEVTRLILTGPNILFEPVGGAPNWVFRRQGASAGAGAPTSSAPGRSGGMTLRFRRVEVVNGMVTFRLPERTNVIGLRRLDLRDPTDRGRLDLDTVLVYSDYKPFSLDISAVPTGRPADPWTTSLHLAAFGATASATGTTSLDGRYDLRIDAQAPALEALNALLPQMRLPALHQASLSTRLSNTGRPGDLPVIGATRLHVGSAELGDRVPGLSVGAVDVSLSATGRPAVVAAVGRFGGEVFKLAGTVGVPARLDGQASVPLDLAMQTRTGSITSTGRVTLDAMRFRGLDTLVGLRIPSLAAMRPLLSRGPGGSWAGALPALTDVAMDGRVVVPADPGSLELRDVHLSARQGDLSGTVAVGPGMRLTARLHATRLDLDAVRAAFGPSPPAPALTVGSGPMIPDTPLPWALLRGPAIDVTADIATLTAQRLAWRDVSLAVQLADGRLRLGRVGTALPGGPAELSMTADAASDQVPVDVALHAQAVPLSLITGLAGLPGQARGDLRVEGSLHAAGRSAHEMAASLDGTMALTMIGGSVSNAALIRLTAAALKELRVTVPADGETGIRCFGLIGRFSKGIGRFPTIALSTPYLELSGAGQLDLGAETVALRLYPLARLSGARVAVPVLVQGPFRAVAGGLDAGLLGKVGLLIDAWLGGDRPRTCRTAGLVDAP